ncbi:MAG: YjbE family putative metal transport protein [Alphaproteobacteria bacterium]|nr:YjbE family putative metal transport protein [Alphaproteobacteria bacterium]
MVFDVAALVQVILIDLALAGDNAVAVGLAAAALPAAQQRRVIALGIALALALRVTFALMTVQLLQFKGLLLAGGLLLLWVAWRMWRDISAHTSMEAGLAQADAAAADGTAAAGKAPASFGRALLSIVIADVSMSLDNVLAVAGVSRHAPEIMAFGLVLSVLLMGVAASVVAGVIQRFRWIAVVGVVVIVIAALRMIWEDAHHFLPGLVPGLPAFLQPPAPPV